MPKYFIYWRFSTKFYISLHAAAVVYKTGKNSIYVIRTNSFLLMYHTSLTHHHEYNKLNYVPNFSKKVFKTYRKTRLNIHNLRSFSSTNHGLYFLLCPLSFGIKSMLAIPILPLDLLKNCGRKVAWNPLNIFSFEIGNDR